jgi:hypothetical protein
MGFYGLKNILEAAATYKKPNDISIVHYICCSCFDCSNKKTSNIEEICEHLIHRGFMSGYICWMEHGEHKEVVHNNDEDDLDEMLCNVEGDFTCKR